MRKHLFLFVLCALSPLIALGQATVSARLDSTHIQIGSQCELTVEVRARQNAAISWQKVKDKKLSSEIEVVTERDGSRDDDGQQTWRRVYTLTAWDEGKLTVPPINVVVDGKKYQTAAIPLEVTPVAVDSIRPDDPMPPYDIQEMQIDAKEWTPLYLYSLLALALLALAWHLSSRLRSGKPVIRRKRTIRREPSHTKALREIDAIKSARLDGSNDQKTYYTLLTETLRKYMSVRFGFNAMEMTSQEIIDHLRSEQDQTKIDELHELFATADLVKFARFAADRHTGEMYLANVVRFIEDTKLAETPTETHVEEPLTDDDRTRRRRRRWVRMALWASIGAASALVAYVVYSVYLLI